MRTSLLFQAEAGEHIHTALKNAIIECLKMEVNGKVYHNGRIYEINFKDILTNTPNWLAPE